jgi:hypothetical protein
MLQPFEKFKPLYLERLIKLGKNFLVTQTYRLPASIVGTTEKIPLLISDYDNYTLAKTHWDAVKNDRYAAVIRLDKKEHKEKLLEMLSGSSQYDLHWAVISSAKELELKVNTKYKDHIRRYIDRNTTWRMNREASVRPVLQMIFGELFITLKYAGQTLRVKFEDIEQS